MSKWEDLTLTEAGITLIDCDHKTPPPADKGLPYVAIPQMKNGYIDFSDARLISEEDFEIWTRKANPQVNDVVLSRRCNPGESSYVAEGMKFALGQNLVLLRSDGKLVKKPFLRWLIKSPAWWAEVRKNINVGAVFNSLKCREIINFTLPIPPIEEQEEITKTLYCLDRKIENLRKQNETLEAIAQTLFKHWFIDFEFPNADGKPYKSSGGAMEPSELGEIPAGWRVVRMEEIADRIAMGPFGSRITTDNFVDSGVPIIRGGNLVNGFNERDFVYLTEEKADDLKSSNAFPEDIVFTHRGTLGQVGFIPTNSTYPRYVVSQSQMLLGVNKALASSRLVYRFFCSKVGLNAILANKNTTGVPSIGRPTTTLKSIQIALPEDGIMNQFDSLIKATDSKIEANDRQIQTLTKTRDTLLPKLMSGKLRVGGD
ncbi:restriction endonuclease subunit S [filamentous cyanobacterium LEGE 11480]|uniref:Restriction endonuclease subunit S n=1 Tax=Romeriopsis navalis LEGE 11480 TaxID=2777977 RepID=A0A928VK16_9CYAN|nr:restriction endonuclease subunit S [Romeriopsis navalis]MBE9030043.1 restriction endonuclease subunit S [Romeriopsis navalis LEGE 11480]